MAFDEVYASQQEAAAPAGAAGQAIRAESMDEYVAGIEQLSRGDEAGGASDPDHYRDGGHDDELEQGGDRDLDQFQQDDESGLEEGRDQSRGQGQGVGQPGETPARANNYRLTARTEVDKLAMSLYKKSQSLSMAEAVNLARQTLEPGGAADGIGSTIGIGNGLAGAQGTGAEDLPRTAGELKAALRKAKADYRAADREFDDEAKDRAWNLWQRLEDHQEVLQGQSQGQGRGEDGEQGYEAAATQAEQAYYESHARAQELYPALFDPQHPGFAAMRNLDETMRRANPDLFNHPDKPMIYAGMLEATMPGLNGGGLAGQEGRGGYAPSSSSPQRTYQGLASHVPAGARPSGGTGFSALMEAVQTPAQYKEMMAALGA